MADRILPVVKSIILCEDVLPGPTGTQNVHLINVFQNIRPRSQPAFPYRIPQLCVFLQLTDAEGEAPAYVMARKADSDQTVFWSETHRLRFRDRLQLVSAIFRLRNCRFPDPGLYFMEFYYDERWVADQPIRLLG